MKITIPAADLRAAFVVAAGYVQPAADKTLYCHVKLSASPSGSYIVAQHMTAGNGVRIPLPTMLADGEATIMLPTDQLGRILKSAGSELLTLIPDDTKLKINSKRSKWSVTTFDATTFAEADYALGDKQFSYTVHAADLTAIFDQASMIANEDVGKWSLSNVQLDFTENELVAAANDSRKGIRCRTPIVTTLEGWITPKVLVPGKSIGKVKSVFNDPAKPLMVLHRSNDILIRDESGIAVICRQGHGNFPNPSTWLNMEGNFTNPINPEDFIQAVEQASAVVEAGEDKFHPSKVLAILFRSNMISIQSVASERGSSDVEFAASWDHDPVDIYVLPEHLLRMIKALFGMPFRFGIDMSARPTLLIQSTNFDGMVCCHEGPQAGKVA